MKIANMGKWMTTKASTPQNVIQFALTWADRMEREMGMDILWPYPEKDAESVIKKVAYSTAADADNGLFVAARDVLVKCWDYGNILAKYT